MNRPAAGLAAQADTTQAAGTLPAVWPAPQQVTQQPGAVPIPDTVTEVAGANTDQAALTALAAVLHSAGVATITQVTAGNPVPHGALTIYAGTPDDNPDVGPALDALGAQGPAGLPSGGYVLAAGHTPDGNTVVLAGAGGSGTFYAVQTLRQLITGRAPQDVVVRDWPSISVRGVIEGFYGPSWSDDEIASQLQFYGANKLNTFVYSAKNDPYLRDDWQQLYPPDQLAALTQLVTDAQAEHVNFVYALSPGLSICYSDPSDLAALEAKDQQLWSAGVRQFALFFDDIGSGLHCAADSGKFAGSPDPLAAAQAYLLNEFVTGFIDTHPGAQELITVPTDYAGDADSAYREVWKASLNPDVLVYWTGVGVIPQTVTAAQAQQTASEFGHQIVVWDNYPVNDYQPTRLFLGPLVGRGADLDTAVAGFTSNPMQEPAASTIPEFTTADYTWNPAAYDNAPDAAWAAGIGAYGGPAAAALQVFAENNQSTPRIGTLPESPELASHITSFWTAYKAASGVTPALHAAASAIPEVVGEGVFENFLLTADPALFSYDVRLYAADSADYQAALAAASAAGLPADQVTQAFTTAWDATSAGEYLVIAVGGPANDALYYNVCGWTAPNGIGAGSTPFYYTTSAHKSLLPMDEYENGAGQTAANTAARAADLAYYAVHGAFPAGVTAPPAAIGAQYACVGSPGS